MEQLDKKIENLEDRMTSFRNEIKEIMREERETKKTAYFSSFPESELKVDDLSIEDMEIWEKVKDGTISQEDFHSYQEKTVGFGENMGIGASPSQKDFFAFITNKATPILRRRMGRGNPKT